MLKKVYIEITNSCNLKCDFCIQNKGSKKFMTIDEFTAILDKLNGYTKYLYFHILGEPLLHPQVRSLIKFAHDSGFYVNITTNGYLISRIRNVSNIRQLNISLHSYDEKYHIALEDYMNSIFEVVDELKDTYVSYRLWVKNDHTEEILKLLNKHYNTLFELNDIISARNITVNSHIFINSFHEFIWPDLENEYYSCDGTCYAIRDHIGILVDGTIVPCCLDTKGDINLGNIFDETLDSVLQSRRVLHMMNGFQNKMKYEELCRHCSFIDT